MASIPPLAGAALGRPTLPGSMTVISSGCDLIAAGADIWLAADEGHFAWFAHEGDFDFRAQVMSFEASHLYAKAGLMVRESLAADSRHAFFLTFRNDAARNNNNGGYEGQFRAATNGPSTGVYPPQPDPVPSRFPVRFPDAWLRMVRRGDELQFFQGADGAKWNHYGSITLTLPRPVLLGVAATSHDPAELATARFRALSVR